MELATETRCGAKWWKMNNREATLKGLIARGERYEDVAVKMETTVGSICAKASRLKIGRGQPPQPFFWHGKPTPLSPEAPDRAYHEIMARQKREAAERRGFTVKIEKLEPHHCRFPIGDPRHQQCCGIRRVPGSPYCAEHAARCVGQERGPSAGLYSTPGGWTRVHGGSQSGADHIWIADARTFEIHEPEPAPA